MCNFFSGILMKDGRVLYDLDIDDHSKLIEKLGLKDDKLQGLRSWIKFEITPKDSSVFNKRKSNWVFKVDEESKIEWVSDRMIKNAYAALQTVLKKRVITEGGITIKDGRWYVGGQTKAEAYDSSTVMAHGSSTVEAYGSSIVKAYDSSIVKAHGSSTVEAYGSSIVIIEAGFKGKVSVSENAQEVKRKLG